MNYKGIDLAIRALAHTQKDITLDIFGDGEMAATWMQLADELGVASRVNFLGWCPHNELMTRMRDYRAYLFPTLAEANGIVMQEAMMIGLPVVSLRWGGPEGLADDSSAILIEPKDQAYVVAQLADAITRLANDPGLANQIATAAREIAEEHFPWSRVQADWSRWYVPSEHSTPAN